MIRNKKILKLYFCNYYKILNVSNDASLNDIKKSFNQLAKKHHPDIAQIPNEQFIKIRKAYQILKDKDKRSQYDFELIHGSQASRRQHYYYYGQDQYSNPSMKAKIRQKIILGYVGRLGVILIMIYFLSVLSRPMTDHEIRRQNIILSRQNIDSGPSTQQKRRKQFQQEMKQKKISSKIIEVKVWDGTNQTTKKRHTRKNTMDAIPGVKKQIVVATVLPTQQFI